MVETTEEVPLQPVPQPVPGECHRLPFGLRIVLDERLTVIVMPLGPSPSWLGLNNLENAFYPLLIGAIALLVIFE